MWVRAVFSVVGVDRFETDLQIAADLCADAGAHLSVLVVALASPPPIGSYAAVLSDPWREERENDLVRLGECTQQIESLIAKIPVSASLDREYTEMAWADLIIGERGRYADLTVIGPDLLSDDELRSRAIDGALFTSGKPLLILPGLGTSALHPKTVLLAWDSRLAAVRAVREALDIMRNADQVHVTIVDPEATTGRDGPEPGADIAAYLARHDIKVVVDRLPSAGVAIADVLRRHARDIAADVVVMGAYGHSRMRQRIFGGVTRAMIEKITLPLFLAR
ncbi:nucleotide-binding universal stress UspA family protein [Mesorhizobium soli]|uniref:universal stress protein n=1 Tax=Pseudaminobacter soli (ex Li et al. 2025) TaxID=1295366 RepID=UPI002476EEB8|nr:universal stress protein [Mesorhizobium soli]MDH6231863.1 nucleotide-binding universal stress UspA family protein [Mesorhizobium soli]